MRDSKFRAWDEENHKFVYFNARSGLYCLPSNVEIWQYTGLKDKNGEGEEMCQGDVVYASGHGKGVVDKNCWGEWGLKYQDDFIPIHDLVMEGDLGEIQGNIHKNPELLEQQK